MLKDVGCRAYTRAVGHSWVPRLRRAPAGGAEGGGLEEMSDAELLAHLQELHAERRELLSQVPRAARITGA